MDKPVLLDSTDSVTHVSILLLYYGTINMEHLIIIKIIIIIKLPLIKSPLIHKTN